MDDHILRDGGEEDGTLAGTLVLVLAGVFDADYSRSHRVGRTHEEEADSIRGGASYS